MAFGPGSMDVCTPGYKAPLQAGNRAGDLKTQPRITYPVGPYGSNQPLWALAASPLTGNSNTCLAP